MLLATSFGLALSACVTSHADRSICRVEHPHTPVTSADPFEAAQLVSGPSLAPQDPTTQAPAGWGCVHATHETRGLIATGGSYPCLAAMGDVRQSADPDADAIACPPWIPTYTVALFSDERTRALRSAGVEDACCYEYRVRIFE